MTELYSVVGWLAGWLVETRSKTVGGKLIINVAPSITVDFTVAEEILREWKLFEFNCHIACWTCIAIIVKAAC